MLEVRLNVIVAMLETTQGMGKDGGLPWHFNEDFARFVTLTSRTRDANRRNAVVMGRRVWESIPCKFRPLRNRVNVVLSREWVQAPEKGVILAASFDSALAQLDAMSDIENVWVLGGRELYQLALDSPRLARLYVTWIDAPFETDVEFPRVDWTQFREVDPVEERVENGVRLRFVTYEKKTCS
jgi:dihydrofolate reductase